MKLINTLAISALLLGTVASAKVNKKACFACHGQTFEKHAMGKSKIVKDMNNTEVSTALLGYKEGTYGGPLKGIMKGQISRYSDKDIITFSETFKK